MKKIVKLLSTVIFVFILAGCKNIEKLSYTKFNEYFSNKDGYTIIDQTDKYDIDVRKFIEAGDGDVQYFYIEFDNETSADKYLKTEYKNYKIKDYKKYSYIKDTKNGYMKLYKINNVIVYAKTSDKKYTAILNKTLKELGY